MKYWYLLTIRYSFETIRFLSKRKKILVVLRRLFAKTIISHWKCQSCGCEWERGANTFNIHIRMKTPSNFSDYFPPIQDFIWKFSSSIDPTRPCHFSRSTSRYENESPNLIWQDHVTLVIRLVFWKPDIQHPKSAGKLVNGLSLEVVES